MCKGCKHSQTSPEHTEYVRNAAAFATIKRAGIQLRLDSLATEMSRRYRHLTVRVTPPGYENTVYFVPISYKQGRMLKAIHLDGTKYNRYSNNWMGEPTGELFDSGCLWSLGWDYGNHTNRDGKDGRYVLRIAPPGGKT